MPQESNDIIQFRTELERLNRQLHELLANSKDMLFRMSLLDGTYEYVSPSSLDLIGYSPEELYANPLLIREIIHPDWLEYFEEQWKLLKKGIMPPYYEYQIIRKSGETRWLNQRNHLVKDNQGNAVAIESVVTDISEQRRMNDALDSRIMALTQPTGDIENINFTDLFDLSTIQHIQDEFSIAAGVASRITDPKGVPITKPSNFSRFCEEFIKNTEQGRINCAKSDAVICRYNPNGPTLYKCPSAGLWDAGAAIAIDSHHIASWHIGQVRDENQSEEEMREYARQFGGDEDEAVKAYKEIPTMSRARFEQIAEALFVFANQLSLIAYQNMQQARLIVELEKKEKELQDREARLQEYQKMAKLGSWYWEIESGDVQWSDEVYKIFKLDPNEFVPQIDSIMKLSPWPGDRDRHNELIQKAMQDKTLGTFEQRFLFPDGSIGYYFSTFQGVYDENGVLLAVKGTVQDITERKKAEEALKENETLLRTLIRTIPDLVWLKDTKGVFLSCNSRMESLYGAKEEDIVGKTDYDFVDKEIADSFRMHDKYAIKKGSPCKNEEEVIFASDGHSELLETIKTPMYRSDGELAGVLGIGRDITERRLAEEQLQIRERMDSIGTLASGIAHDFNNLLGGIMGNLDLLRMDNKNLSSEQNDCLNESYELSHKAARLVKSLLSLTRSTVSDVRSLDIYDVVKEVFGILTRTTDRLIEKKLDIIYGKYRVLGQYDQLHQVFLNLGTNAIQAIEEKGVLPGDFIRAQATFCRPNEAEKRGLLKQEYIHIIFEDNGVGMTEDIRRRAFEPLYSTKERGTNKGQGLGLAMVYNIITQNHQGSIEIESSPDVGTKFHIFLPQADQAIQKSANQVADFKGGSETILIVEDEESVSRMATKALQKYGYSVIVANDGEEGFATYQEKQDTIDLIILDLTLPKLSGEMVLEKILNIKPDAKIIISTGQSNYTSEALKRAKALVAKPYKLSDLAKTVRETLDI